RRPTDAHCAWVGGEVPAASSCQSDTAGRMAAVATLPVVWAPIAAVSRPAAPSAPNLVVTDLNRPMAQPPLSGTHLQDSYPKDSRYATFIALGGHADSLRENVPVASGPCGGVIDTVMASRDRGPDGANP